MFLYMFVELVVYEQRIILIKSIIIKFARYCFGDSSQKKKKKIVLENLALRYPL